MEIVRGPRVGREGPLRLVVNCVLLDAQRRVMLMRRRDNGYWALPGGGVEPGESVAEALVREVEEETGLRVRPVQLVGVYSNPDVLLRYADGHRCQPVSLTFRCELVGGAPRETEEATAVAWFAIDALPELLPIHHERLADALAARPSAAIR